MPSIDIFLQTLINGLFLGGVYALVAGGLTIIYGVLMIINFAHGEFMMLGMYLAFWMFTLFGVDPYVAMLSIAIIIFFFGALIQIGLIAPILKAPLINQILLTVGLQTLIIGLVQFFWGAEPKSLILPYSTSKIVLFDLVLNLPRLIAFVVSIFLAIIMHLVLKYTKTGKAIRACSQSREASMLMGIDVSRIFILTMGVGAAMTAIAGVLLTPSFPMSPRIGMNIGVTAFIIVVLGTMGNYMGALVGGLIIGLAETFGGLFIGSSMKQVVSMGIFILVLMFKPEGIFGGKDQ